MTDDSPFNLDKLAQEIEAEIVARVCAKMETGRAVQLMHDAIGPHDRRETFTPSLTGRGGNRHERRKAAKLPGAVLMPPSPGKWWLS